MGEVGLQHTLSMGLPEADYRRRVDMLGAFTSKHGLEIRPASSLDAGLSDHVDWVYCADAKAEHGEKCKAALAALHPLMLPPRKLTHPHFNRALGGWRRAAPTFTRNRYPDGASYAISGELIRQGRRSMAIFNILSFRTYLRP